MSETMENVIVLIVMVAIVIGLLCFVGYGNIKEWLFTPFVWKNPDFLHIEYTGTLEKGNDKYISFLIYNSSENKIDEYSFQVIADTKVIEFDDVYADTLWDSGFISGGNEIEANGFTTLLFHRNSLYDDNEYLASLNSDDIEKLQYRVIQLESRGEEIISNHSWAKVITILVASLMLGLLGFVERFPVWLRIALKVCGLPCLLVLGILLVIFACASGSSNSSSSNNSASESAKKRYKRAASLKAGAIKTGSVHNAAKAQEEMDKAMADIIVANGSGSSSEREAATRYKRAASHKAGAIMTGRSADAARSQAEMDRAIADMINK